MDLQLSNDEISYDMSFILNVVDNSEYNNDKLCIGHCKYSKLS